MSCLSHKHPWCPSWCNSFQSQRRAGSSLLLLLAALHGNTDKWRQSQSRTPLGAKAKPGSPEFSLHQSSSLRCSSVPLCAVLSLLGSAVVLLVLPEDTILMKAAARLVPAALSKGLRWGPGAQQETSGLKHTTRSSVCPVPVSSQVSSFLSEQVSLARINSFLQRGTSWPPAPLTQRTHPEPSEFQPQAQPGTPAPQWTPRGSRGEWFQRPLCATQRVNVNSRLFPRAFYSLCLQVGARDAGVGWRWASGVTVKRNCTDSTA